MGTRRSFYFQQQWQYHNTRLYTDTLHRSPHVKQTNVIMASNAQPDIINDGSVVSSLNVAVQSLLVTEIRAFASEWTSRPTLWLWLRLCSDISRLSFTFIFHNTYLIIHSTYKQCTYNIHLLSLHRTSIHINNHTSSTSRIILSSIYAGVTLTVLIFSC